MQARGRTLTRYAIVFCTAMCVGLLTVRTYETHFWERLLQICSENCSRPELHEANQLQFVCFDVAVERSKGTFPSGEIKHDNVHARLKIQSDLVTCSCAWGFFSYQLLTTRVVLSIYYLYA